MNSIHPSHKLEWQRTFGHGSAKSSPYQSFRLPIGAGVEVHRDVARFLLHITDVFTHGIVVKGYPTQSEHHQVLQDIMAGEVKTNDCER